jgi:hypothetical protein
MHADNQAYSNKVDEYVKEQTDTAEKWNGHRLRLRKFRQENMMVKIVTFIDALTGQFS